MIARNLSMQPRGQDGAIGTAQGLAASFAALGLGRFGFGMGLPLLAAALPGQEAVVQWLVAAHLAGYLAWTLRSGFVLGHDQPDLRAYVMRFAACTLTLAATAVSTHMMWLALCRFATGYACGALLAATPVMQLQAAPGGQSRREGVSYMGGGLALMLSAAAAMAAFMSGRPQTAAVTYWMLLALFATVAALPGFLGPRHDMHRSDVLPTTKHAKRKLAPVPRYLVAAIALFGCVLATPTMWWAYALLQLDRPEIAMVQGAALLTAAVGAGALIGPWAARFLLRRQSAERVAAVLLGGMAVGLLLPLVLSGLTSAVAAALLCGVPLTGATLALRHSCLRRCADPRAAWAHLTRVSAMAQVASACAIALVPPAAFAPVLFASSALLALAASVSAAGGER